MKSYEIKSYWENSMALSGRATFTELKHYLKRSGELGLTLLNTNTKLLEQILDIQKLTLEMKSEVSVLENKKYFLKLAEEEMIKAKQILNKKFDATYRLLAQNGFDVAGLRVDNLFEFITKLEAEEKKATEPTTEPTTEPHKRKNRIK